MQPVLQVQIAALGQYAYCPRRCALMYLENLMEANEHTVAGTILHQTVDEPAAESRGSIKRFHALPLFSDGLGLVGKSDLVEVVDGIPHPVEFKKGRKSAWDNNYIQLCAQALCLTEMLRVSVPTGSIFNLTTKKRVQVQFDSSLIERTKETILHVRSLLSSVVTPPAELKAQCEGCSLHAICLPELSTNAVNTKTMMDKLNLFRAKPIRD